MGRKRHRLSGEVLKYYRFRHDIFSLFDQGIKLTEEQWYSVTPESVAVTTAIQISERYPLGTIVIDGFGGAGGNTIQFALSEYFEQVYYNDLNHINTELAIHNSKIYDTFEWIQFMTKDFFSLKKDDFQNPDSGCETSDNIVIFASPPWGGPSYTSSDVWDLSTSEPSVFDIVKHCRTITNQICLFLPRTSNLDQISTLVLEGEEVLVDYVFIRGHCKGMLVFLGTMVS
ncbi:Tgs1p [Sugiyamaella lignohabitans]|uniref:Trimethylguanosine synthase n=1 Tax=Sugiyamaella lignohabitans TaxID=796027 RepID=A0A167FYU6_9ASCO|nr:Tgs1p [Sugiyamaella lignohabitans]ANB15879.1 Tgs1p [Sugiyamaella lignohabitans]